MKISSDNIQVIYAKYNVSAERAKHSLRVADIAQDLAKKHSVNPSKAWLAGALHDIAREWSFASLLKYSETHNIEVSNEDRGFPPLLHGKIAADVSEKELKIKNTEILSAIKHHTSGKANMSKLEMILYLADFLESTMEMPKYQNIRDAIAISLPKAVNLANLATVSHLKNQGYKPTQALLENIDFYSNYK